MDELDVDELELEAMPSGPHLHSHNPESSFRAPSAIQARDFHATAANAATSKPGPSSAHTQHARGYLPRADDLSQQETHRTFTNSPFPDDEAQPLRQIHNIYAPMQTPQIPPDHNKATSYCKSLIGTNWSYPESSPPHGQAPGLGQQLLQGGQHISQVRAWRRRLLFLGPRIVYNF